MLTGELPRDVADVLAPVATAGKSRVIRPLDRLQVAQPDAEGQDVHLAARVVDVVLALDVPTHRLQQVRHRGTAGRAAAVSDVERTGRVDRHELHLYPLAGEAPRPAPRGVRVDDVGRDALKGAFGHREVDEAGAGHRRRLDVARRRQGGDDARREVARVHARGAGQPERDRTCEIAVPGVAGALDHDRGHRLDIELSAGAKGADGARDERFESAFQGFLPACGQAGFHFRIFLRSCIALRASQSSSELDGVDVEGPAKPARGPDLGELFDPGPQERLEVRA